jgi:hypothetical protein
MEDRDCLSRLDLAIFPSPYGSPAPYSKTDGPEFAFDVEVYPVRVIRVPGDIHCFFALRNSLPQVSRLVQKPGSLGDWEIAIGGESDQLLPGAADS